MIHENLDLTIFPQMTVRTEDTFAAACWLLGIAPQPGIDGKPITRILEPVNVVGE